MFLPSGSSFKCHEEVWSLQPMIPPKCFDIFPLTGGCSEGLDAFRFFFQQLYVVAMYVLFGFEALEIGFRWLPPLDSFCGMEPRTYIYASAERIRASIFV